MTSYLIEEALSDCERALDKPEKWLSACTILSHLFASEGRRQSAYLWKTLGTQNRPSRLSFHVLAAAAYAQLKNWKAALSHNHKVLAMDEEVAIAYFNLAHIYEQLGERKKGQDYLYKFMMLRPHQPDAKTCENLGLAFLQRDQKTRAIQCYLWAIQNDPDLWSAYYRLADLMSQSGQPDLAIYCYRQLLKRDPRQGEASHKLGMLLLEQGDRPAAVKQFQDAIAKQPKFVWSHLNLVRILMQMKRWDEAIEACEAALQHVNPDLPWPYRHMARAWLAKGEESRGIECYQQLCEREGWPQAKQNQYHFTKDMFTHYAPLWLQKLRALREQAIHPHRPLRAAIIGCGQGMVSCWLLDNLLTSPDDRLVCIEQNFLPLFKLNLDRSKASQKARLMQGQPTQLLAKLEAFHYNLIVIQADLLDAKNSATSSIYQAVTSWRSLNAQGIMVLGNCSKDQPERMKRDSIERFLLTIQKESRVLHWEQQLFIQKI